MDFKGKPFIFVFCGYLFLAYSSLAGTISLSTDVSLPAPNPDPNDIITIWVQSDAPLFLMNIKIHVNGDATITEAMTAADCNDFGWEPNSLPASAINPDSVELSGLNWSNNYNETVGYFKFRCNSGQVGVYIDIDSSFAFSWNESFTCSDEPITIGTPELPPLIEREGTEPVLLENPTNASGPSRGEMDSFDEWSQQVEMFEMLDSEPIVYVIDSDITENQVWDANDIYYIVGDPNNSYIVDVNSLLVIEPGTTVIMGYQSGLHVSDGGTLIAKGIPDRPIIFTPDWVFFDYPDYVGYYWQVYSSYGPYYHCPIYIEETASPLTTVQYCMIEGAVGGVITDNIRLNHPIENNYMFGNVWGVYEFGPMLTDVRNNLYFYQDQAAIEIELCPDPNEFADLDHAAIIEHNTCDGSGYTYCGITVHGVADPNSSGIPTIYLTNNIVTSNYHYGLNLVDGAMYALVASTGYFDNYYNKNWEFDEYNPVATETNPFYPYTLDYPWQHHYLVDDANFVDAGLQYIERSYLIGTKTNAGNLPDKDIVDLGFHHSMWDYVGGEGILGTDMDDLVEISDYWLCHDPYDPNSPTYDPNIFDPNSPSYISDPNLITFGGDWNGDRYVDFADLAIMAQIWKAAPVVPDLTANIEGNPNDGLIWLSVSGDSDSQLVYAYQNGKLLGQISMLGDTRQIPVDVSEFGNLPQEIKFMAIDMDGHFAFSGITEINYTSPLSYCIVPTTYEPNEPIPFRAFNTGVGVATVQLYGDGGQLVWSQNFSGNTISGSIPADYTGIQHTVDEIVISSASGGFTGKKTYPRVSSSGVDTNVKALLVMPDPKLFIYDPQCRYAIVRAFYDRGIPFKTMEFSEATWENVAKYGQYGSIKYLYFLGHGNYKYTYGDPNNPTTIYRTRQAFANGTVLSCKASEFETPPSWCVSFPENIERGCPTWASMQFDRLQYVYNDACYGGRLKINGAGQLVEGQAGELGFVFDGPQHDLSIALGMNGTYEPRCYQGWWDKGWFGGLYQTSFQDWCKNIWNSLHDGKNLYDAYMYAIQENEDFHPLSAVYTYRLKGHSDIIGLNQIRLTIN